MRFNKNENDNNNLIVLLNKMENVNFLNMNFSTALSIYKPTRKMLALII